MKSELVEKLTYNSKFKKLADGYIDSDYMIEWDGYIYVFDEKLQHEYIVVYDNEQEKELLVNRLIIFKDDGYEYTHIKGRKCLVIRSGGGNIIGFHTLL